MSYDPCSSLDPGLLNLQILISLVSHHISIRWNSFCWLCFWNSLAKLCCLKSAAVIDPSLALLSFELALQWFLCALGQQNQEILGNWVPFNSVSYSVSFVMKSYHPALKGQLHGLQTRMFFSLDYFVSCPFRVSSRVFLLQSLLSSLNRLVHHRVHLFCSLLIAFHTTWTLLRLDHLFLLQFSKDFLLDCR